MMSHLLRELSKLFQNGENVACDKEALDQVPADKDPLAIRSQFEGTCLHRQPFLVKQCD